MILRTARVTYKGPDRVDVSRSSGISAFAPSRGLLNGYKSGDVPWQEYKIRYIDEMRRSYQNNRAEWNALLRMPEVTLCCYCRAGDSCHRLLLAHLVIKICHRRAINIDYQLERLGDVSQGEMFNRPEGSE